MIDLALFSIPESISVGPLVIHIYGLLIGLGVVVGAGAAERIVRDESGRFMIRPSDVWDSLFLVLIWGLIGARAYHVTDLWDYYQQNLVEIFSVWKGGLGIYGGVAGGLVGALWYARKNQTSFLGLLDAVAFGLPLGQAIGRIGNFVNQELFGLPTSLPWGIQIDFDKRPLGYELYTSFHPLFLYEGIWSMLGFGGLYWLLKNNRLKIAFGNYLVLYVAWYALGRTMLELLRFDPWEVANVPVAMWVGLGIAFFAFVYIYYRKKRNEWTILAN